MLRGSRSGRRADARRPRRSFRAVQWGFFVLMAAVVAAGLWGVVQRLPRATAIPDEMAGYGLQRSVEGPEALRMVAGLHRGSPQLSEAWVAYYEGGGVVWVGTAASPDAALGQVNAMAEAIGAGGTPFSNLREVSLAGRRVFTVNDGSGPHFFFQGGARVVWVIPPGGTGTPFVEAALRKW